MVSMSLVPDDLMYTKDHEWVRLEAKRVVVGITDHAQTELTDVVYVELPEVGTEFAAGDDFAIVESVKAASEVYAPVSGIIAETNGDLDAKPELINEDPYGRGWIAAFEIKDKGELKALLKPAEYSKLIEE